MLIVQYRRIGGSRAGRALNSRKSGEVKRVRLVCCRARTLHIKRRCQGLLGVGQIALCVVHPLRARLYAATQEGMGSSQDGPIPRLGWAGARSHGALTRESARGSVHDAPKDFPGRSRFCFEREPQYAIGGKALESDKRKFRSGYCPGAHQTHFLIAMWYNGGPTNAKLLP